MAFVSIVNEITSHRVAFLGDNAQSKGAFLGWIQLKRADGGDAGYIYLSDASVESHLGGKSQPGGPYIVMSRPISQALILLTTLRGGTALQIRYSGDDVGSGTGFLETKGGALDAGFAASVKQRFNLTID